MKHMNHMVHQQSSSSQAVRYDVMTSVRQQLLLTFFVTGVILIISFLILPSISWGFMLENEANGTHLSLFGLGMVRFNYANVDGNFSLFEDNEEGFAENFDTDELLSLTMSGVLFHNYMLEGEVHYNPNEYPDWNFYSKLSRDESYVIFGDQPNMFAEPYFTRYTQPFRGLTLHLESERLGMTTFGAIARGETEREELLPDGTSGPYDFTNIPVVPGSEIVVLEIRNQHDPDEVLETIPQERNVDYTIDYDEGELTFVRPVDPETFRGDLVVIVVIYKGQSESRAFNTVVLGSRATIAPTSWTNFGVTYVSEFDREHALSDGFDTRQEVYGLEGIVNLGEAWKLSTEYALSQDHANTATENEPHYAFQAELDGNVGEQVEVKAKYQRVERDFLTFANPDIDTDQQQLELSGLYAYRPDHELKIGYSFLQDNLPPDSETATTTTHRPYIEWDAYILKNTRLFSKYEFINITDDQKPKTADKQTHAFLIGGEQGFLGVPILNTLTVKAEYQYSDVEDKTEQEPDTLTHQGAVRIQAEPVSDVLAYVEQRERLIHDKDQDQDLSRHDISEVGLNLKRWERFSVESKYQYKVVHDLVEDARESERYVWVLSSQYTPFSVLTGTGKIELRDETVFGTEDPDTTSQTLDMEGRLTYTLKKDLTVRIQYNYAQTEEDADITTTTREDTTEFRLNYAFDKRKTRLTGLVKLERDLLEAPPTPETETRTTTYLASAARQLSDHWDIIAQYKREVSELASDTVREDVLGEIGYSSGRFLKFVGGYEYTDFTDNNESTNNYTANSAYVKIIGKL